MNVSVFSKFDMMGGSEFRCVELANGIQRFTNHSAFLLVERKLPDKMHSHIDKNVTVVEDAFSCPDSFYNSHRIIVVNTDTTDFSTIDYWMGKSSRHPFALDIDRLRDKKFFFLYNFLISPSRNLYQLSDAGLDVCILTTNTKFFNEVTKQDRYEKSRILPRYILESPINQNNLNIFPRMPQACVTFGMHSKGVGNKWNEEIEQLILDINKRYASDQIKFRFMGIKKDLREKIQSIPNVACLKENEESVKDFIASLDVFLFFPQWKREEPWARVIAEAMVSGCPIIALDKGGTADQVLKYHNGFLCKKYKDYLKHVIYFIEHKEDITSMSKNSIRVAKRFYTEAIVQKLANLL